MIEAAFVVQVGFKAENEARVLIHTHGTAASENILYKSGPYGSLVQVQDPQNSASGKHEFIGGHNNGKAIVLQIQPSQFIEEVIIGPSASNQTSQQVIGELTAAGLAKKLRK